MGGYIVAGMTGPLVTVGLGGEITVIIQKKKEVIAGGTVRHKRRVQGLHQDKFNKLEVLQSLEEQSEIPISILIPSFKEFEYRAKLIQQIKKWEYKKANIKVSIIRKVGDNKASITEHYLIKNENPIIITAMLSNFIEKAIHIQEHKTGKKETGAKVISIEDLLNDVEKADIIKLIEELEKLDEDSN